MKEKRISVYANIASAQQAPQQTQTSAPVVKQVVINQKEAHELAARQDSQERQNDD